MATSKIISVQLTDTDVDLWTLKTVNQSEDFIKGLIYGGLYLFQTIPEGRIILTYENGDEQFLDNFNDLSYLQEDHTDLKFITTFMIPLEEMRPITGDDAKDYYVWLRHPENNHPDAVAAGNLKEDNLANLVTVKTADFFQGLFTALRSQNIPYERVVLHKPIKNNVAYNIEGLNLPDLKDIARQ